MPRLIDVSRWQGQIDWNKVKGAGIHGAYIKVGGADGSLYRDSRATANLSGAESVGLPFGTYYFCSPRVGDAVRQARHAFECGHGRGDLPPALDLEQHNGLPGPQLDRFAREFCDETLRLTGMESAIYTGAWVGQDGSFFGYTDHSLSHCHLWVANYGTNVAGLTPPSGRAPAVPGVWASKGWSVWQFNSTTRLPGIPENTVDVNVCTDSFWAEAMGEHAADHTDLIPEEWTMRAIQRHDQDSQFHLVPDGYGRLRRAPIYSQAHKAVLIGAAVIDGPLDNTYIVSDPEEVAVFDSIPESNAEYTCDIGGLALAGEVVRQLKEFTASAVAGIPGVAPQAPVDADAIVDEIVERLKD